MNISPEGDIARSDRNSNPNTREDSEDTDLSKQSVTGPNSTTDQNGSPQRYLSFSPELHGPNESPERERTTTTPGSFNVNRPARDSLEGSDYAKRAVSFFDRLEETLAQAVELAKQFARKSDRAEDIAHKTILDIPSLGAISSSLSSIRESLVSGAVADKAATASSTARSTGVEMPGRSNHVLHQLALSEQRDRMPAPLTYTDPDVHSTIAGARGDLGEIASQLQDIEARLVAQCSISPFGNGESLSHLYKLRSVMGLVTEIDVRLRDIAA